MPTLDKEENLPVFDVNSFEYKKFTKKYMKKENLQIIFNNSSTNSYIAYGNLNAEANHGQLKRINHCDNWQSIKLLYIRCITSFFCINTKRLQTFGATFNSKYPLIMHEITNIINNTLRLNFIFTNQCPMIPTIKVNKMELNEIIYKQIVRDKLHFKCCWKRWKKKQDIKLKQFIQNNNIHNINNEILNNLYIFFDKKFSAIQLRSKCHKFGLNFIFD